MYTVTAKHFEAFKQECKLCVKEWKLDDWRVEFEHRPRSGARAQCSTIATNNIATITLATRWEVPVTIETLRYVARHEVAHILTALLDEVAQRRYVTQIEREQACETTTRKLQDILP